MKNWLNKYDDGGPTDPVPPKKKQEPTSMTDYINPMNWFVSNLDDAGTFNQAFAKARNEGMDEFMWYGTRYNTDLAETAAKPKVNDLTSQYEKDFPKTWQYAVALTKLPRYNNIKPEQFMNLLERIRNTETKDQNINQIGGGPGQGYYQFEPESLITTRKRNEILRKELKDIVGMDLPEAAEFKDDFKTLSKDDQSIYGITNLIKAAAAKRQVNPSYQIDFTNPGQAWLDLHWAGAGTHPEDVPVRIKHWNSINPDFQIRSQEIKTTKSSKTANPVKHADGGRTGLTRRYEFYGQYPEYGLGSHVVHGGPAWPRWFDRYEEGGYTVRKTDERAGKTHVVTGPGGTKKYFGDPNMGERGDSKLGKEAFYARHAENLENNPYFRAYARATWETGGTVTDEYKKVRSTVPRVSYTEPSGMYTGPTTQRGITFADGGPTSKNKKVYTNLNEFNIAKQAKQDSSDLYNRFKDDKNNYINFVKAQGLNPNFVEPIIPSSWVAKAEKINPTIEPVIGGMLTSTGAGFERDSKGNVRSFNYYPTMANTDLKVFDDTELGKTLAAGYIGYPKPVVEPVYQPRPKFEPVQFAPMKDFTFSSTEMQPAANPFPTEMITPTVDEIMMPSGQRISRKEFIKQYGKPAWNKATNQGNYKKKNGGSTDPEPPVESGLATQIIREGLSFTPLGSLLPLNARQLAASMVTGDSKFGLQDAREGERIALYNSLENARKRTGQNKGGTEYTDYGPYYNTDLEHLKASPLSILAGSALSSDFNAATTFGRVSYEYDPKTQTYKVYDSYDFSKTPDTGTSYAGFRNAVGEAAATRGISPKGKTSNYIGSMSKKEYQKKTANPGLLDFSYGNVRQTLAPINSMIDPALDAVRNVTTEVKNTAAEAAKTGYNYYNKAKKTASSAINTGYNYLNKAADYFGFEDGGFTTEVLPVNSQTGLPVKTLPEIEITAERPDTYNNYITNKYKDAGLGSVLFGMPLDYVFGYPQAAATKLMTGKYQLPSEAMGIENPIGAFATDAVLDPANLVGAGVLTKDAALARLAASKESGLLSNAYKYNPWAWKPNPEAGYRMIGRKEGYLDAIKSGQIRPTGGYEHAHFNIGEPLNPNRLSPEELIQAGSPGGYNGPYMAEMKHGTWQRMSDAFPNNPEMQEQLRLLGKDKDVWQHPLLGHIKVDDPRLTLYKEDWLRGYKKVPKQEAGGMIKRADGSYSRRGLWDNIRANRGSGKKPTKEMLKQERKIRAAEKKETGGYINKTNNNWLDNL